MAIVDFNSSLWSKPWFRRLPAKAKILYIYSFSNDHKNITGMYPLDLETISFETGLNINEIKEYLLLLAPKIKYDFISEVIWDVEHVRHQFMRTPKISPKIIIGIEKALISLQRHEFIPEFLKLYDELPIFAEDPMYRVSMYPSSGGASKGEGLGYEREHAMALEKTMKEFMADSETEDPF